MLSSNLFNALWLGAMACTFAFIIAVVVFELKSKSIKWFALGAITFFLTGLAVVAVYAIRPAPRVEAVFMDGFVEAPFQIHDFSETYDDTISDTSLDETPAYFAELPPLTGIQQYLADNDLSVADIVVNPSLLINRLTWLLAPGDQVVRLEWDEDNPATLVVEIELDEISDMDVSPGAQALPYAASSATTRVTDELLGITELDNYWASIHIHISGVGDVFFERASADFVYHAYTPYEYEDEVPLAYGLADSWAIGNEIYYVLRDTGRGTMTMIGIRWHTHNGILYVCRSPWLCGEECDKAIQWRYLHDGNYLTLTSVDDPAVTYTYVRADSVGVTALAPPRARIREGAESQGTVRGHFIGNFNTNVFHRASCSHLPDTHNRVFFDTREAAVSAGHRACQRCNP